MAYTNAMPIVRLDKVSLSFGLKPLLDRVDLQMRRGERVCLLGRNGEGKSSLLADNLATDLCPTAARSGCGPARGLRVWPKKCRPASDASVRDVVMGGVGAGRRAMTIGRPNCRPIK